MAFDRVPREDWKNQVGKVIMYSTKIDSAYYYGLLEHVDEEKAVIRYSTWREETLDGVEFGRNKRTLSLDDLDEMVLCLTTAPEDQKRWFEGVKRIVEDS